MSAMTDDAIGFEPDAELVPSEAKIARREMLRQLVALEDVHHRLADRPLLGRSGRSSARR